MKSVKILFDDKLRLCKRFFKKYIFYYIIWMMDCENENNVRYFLVFSRPYGILKWDRDSR